VKGAFTGALRDNPGRVAACDGGTLFLDEIGDLPLSIQPSCCASSRTANTARGRPAHRRADVRILAATNADLEQAIKDGRFREDLYYRLNVIQIEIPPFASARTTRSFCRDHARVFRRSEPQGLSGFADDALLALRNYPWPATSGSCATSSNARPFSARDVIASKISRVHLSASPPIQLGDRVPLSMVEENHIRRVLATTNPFRKPPRSWASTRPPSGASASNSGSDSKKNSHLLVQRQIELQHIDPRFTEDSDVATLGVRFDDFLHCLSADTPCLRHARRLQERIFEIDVRVQAAA